MEYDYKQAMRLSNQLCFPLYAAARSITNLYTPFLKPLGLTYTQYIVLLVLWEKEAATVGELCDVLMLDNGTLSPMLKKLQSSGYIEKRRSEKDDRVVVVSVTDAGKKLQERAKDVPLNVAGCIKLSPDKAGMLYTLLNELLKNQKEDQKNAFNL